MPTSSLHRRPDFNDHLRNARFRRAAPDLPRFQKHHLLDYSTRMKTVTLTLPEIALLAGTRAALGAGVGLLLADKLNLEQRKAVGWTLCGVGLLTTIPLAIEVFGKRNTAES